jgi:hypothetical protein
VTAAAQKNCRTPAGWTPLHYGARGGFTEVGPPSPPSFLIGCGAPQVLEVLFAYDARLNVENNNGFKESSPLPSPARRPAPVSAHC